MAYAIKLAYFSNKTILKSNTVHRWEENQDILILPPLLSSWLLVSDMAEPALRDCEQTRQSYTAVQIQKQKNIARSLSL
jgi:hypothetical protein